MEEKAKSKKAKRIWLSVLLLFVCVAASTVALTAIINDYHPDDRGAISLIPDKGEEPASSGSAPDLSEQFSAADGQTSASSDEPPKNPDFEVSDEETVWGTDTTVELFRVSYENGEQSVTVMGADGDKLIAPGTENSYIFKLKNTGNVALDYSVEIDAFFTPEGVSAPISARINRYDGKWVLGGQQEYADLPALDSAEDSATLGAGKYTYYTLDWMWPFESGNDELDTQLGQLAAQQDVVFTVVIKTVATESADPNADGGITPPYTGDDTKTALWIALAAGSFILIVILLIFGKKQKRR